MPRRGPALRFFTEAGPELATPGVVPVHHWRPDDAAPVPGQPEDAYLAGLEDIEKVRYKDINDATDADINVYRALGLKI